MILLQIGTILVTFFMFTFQLKPYELTVCLNEYSPFNMSNIERKVIDVTAGSTVHARCQYCNAKEDYYPKLWFYKPRGNIFKPMKEMQADDGVKDISITLSHTLNINNFNVNHSGVYTCKSYDELNKNNTPFTYVLDGVIDVDITPKTGTATQWQEYRRTFIDPINNMFKVSAEEPYKTFRKKYNVVLNIYTVWDNWGECKEIGDHQKGIRKRLGRCRIGHVFPSGFATNKSPDLLISYLADGYDVPCRSIKFNESATKISRIVVNIPEFKAEEICTISLNAVNLKRIEEKGKQKSTQQVMESSHVILKCTEIVSKSVVKWFKDKKPLKSSYRYMLNTREDEPHISIDANYSLHIFRISKNEEGNYTCSVNGKKVKEFEVKVVSKSKLLNQEFIRYSIYLGFVLSLTMTCYCAGVCVAWHRRASFLDPLNLHKMKY